MKNLKFKWLLLSFILSIASINTAWAAKKTIYLVPGVWSNGSSEKFWVHSWGSGSDDDQQMLPVEGQSGIYSASIESGNSNYIFTRCSSASDGPWSYEWDRTSSFYDASHNCCEITGWNDADYSMGSLDLSATTNVYVASSAASMKVNVKLCSSANTVWREVTMTKSSKTFIGVPVYTASIPVYWGGVAKLEFKEGSGEYSTKINTWTATSSFGNKFYNGSVWEAYVPDKYYLEGGSWTPSGWTADASSLMTDNGDYTWSITVDEADANTEWHIMKIYGTYGASGTMWKSTSDYVASTHPNVQTTSTDGSGNFEFKPALSDASVTVNYNALTGKFSVTCQAPIVSLEDEGGSGGSGTQTANYGESPSSVTCPSRTGYTFNGYYTAASAGTQIINSSGAWLGSKDGYTNGSTKWIITTNPTLYAQWTPKTTAITFDKNGGSADQTATATYDSNALTSYTKVTWSGHGLDGYYTLSSGGVMVVNASGAPVANVDGYTDASGNWKYTGSTLKLYAQWLSNVSVTYDDNDADSGTVPVDATDYIPDGEHNATVLGNSGSLAKDGYTWVGWNTMPDGSGETYVKDDEIEGISSNVTLYAKWSEIMSTLTTANSYDGASAGFDNPSKSVSSIGISTTATVTAADNDLGYTLTSWTIVNGERTDGGADDANPIIVRSDGSGSTVTVTANYEGSNRPVNIYLPNAHNSWATTSSADQFYKLPGESGNTVTWTKDINREDYKNNSYQFGGFYIYQSGWGTKTWKNSSSQDTKMTSHNSSDWGFNTSDGSYSTYIDLPLSGTYTFTLTNSNSNSSQALTVTYPDASFVEGEFETSWGENYTMTDDGTYETATVTVTSTGDKQFRLVSHGKLWGTGTKITKASNTQTLYGKHMTEDGAVCTLSASVVGDYVFTYNKSTHELEVTWPTVEQLQIYSSTKAGDEAVQNYNWDSHVGNVYTKTVALSGGYDYTFKAVASSNHYGLNSGLVQRSTSTSSNTLSSLSTDGGNMTIKADFDGDYTFTFDVSEKTLVVTYPTAYQATYTKSIVGTDNETTSAPTASYNSGATSVTSATTWIPTGTDVTFLAANAGDGYTWKGWYSVEDPSADYEEDLLEANKSYTAEITSAVTIYAVYEEDMHTVTVTAGTHGSITTPDSGTPRTVQAGIATAASIGATAATDYYFGEWEQVSGSVTFTNNKSASTTVKATEDSEIKANFVSSWTVGGDFNSWNMDQYGLDNFGKRATGSKQDTAYVEIDFLANTNYSFKIYDRANTQWWGNENYCADADCSANAYINYASNNGQEWKFETGRRDCGLTTAGKGTYKFAWNITDKKMAVYFPTSWTVTYNVSTFYNEDASHDYDNTTGGTISYAKDNDSITLTSGKYVVDGGTMTFKATPATGYTFAGWYKDQACSSEYTNGSDGAVIADGVLTLTIEDNNKTVYAKFTENMTTVKIRSNKEVYGNSVTAGDNTIDNTYGNAHGWGKQGYKVGVHTGLALTANPGAAYYFSDWTIPGGADFELRNNDGDEDRAVNLYGLGGGESDQTLTVVFEKLEEIYFENRSGSSLSRLWNVDAIYAYFNVSWIDGPGSYAGAGNTTRENIVTTQLTPVIEGSTTYMGYVPRSVTKAQGNSTINIAFSDTWMGDNTYPDKAWRKFSGGKGVFRSDYNKRLNEFVPYHEKSITSNSTDYYSNGYWKVAYVKKDESIGYYIKNNNNSEVNLGEFKGVQDYRSVGEAVARIDYIDTRNLYIVSAGGEYYKLVGNPTVTHLACSNLKMESGGDSKAGFALTPSTEGYYTFRIEMYGDQMALYVDYPVGPGDYRLEHTYNSGANKTHSDIIKNTKAETKNRYSMYLSTTGSPTLKLQECDSIKKKTLEPAWSDVTNSTSNLDAIITALTENGTGVYQFDLSIDTTNDVVKAGSVDSVRLYDGPYYIKTDCAPGSWANYKSNAMTLNTINYKKTDPNTFDYYFCSWIGDAGTNIKCVIANDYSTQLSDTLIDDAILGSGVQTMPYAGNVRFSYNSYTNAIRRAYLNGSTNYHDKFLWLEGYNSKVDADPSTDGVQANNKLTDKGNWTYMLDVKAKETARVRLTAKFGNNDASGKIQSLIGDKDGDISASNTVEILGGSSSSDTWNDIRLIYDFKTNHMLSAWLVPSSDDSESKAINTDILILRDNQDPARQITFADEDEVKKLSEVDTVYAALCLTKSFMTDESGLDAYSRRAFYWVSFPFDVKVSDIFGSAGAFGVDWITQTYNGKRRAEEGYWIDSDSNWDFMSINDTLKAGHGYVVTLDLSEFGEYSSKWNNGVTEVYLYFPSIGKVGTIDIENRSIDLGDPNDYECKITRASRNVYDSYWHCIGAPSFAEKTRHANDPRPSWYDEGNGDLPDSTKHWTTELLFVYDYVEGEDFLIAKFYNEGGGDFTFEPMHSYLVQYKQRNINWTSVVTPKSSVVARRARQANEISDITFRLELKNETKMLDQTFVHMSDNDDITNNYDFNYDLAKESSAGRSNLWTVTADTIKAAANCLPLSEQTTLIPVGVKTTAAGDYTFSIPNGTNGVGIILIDNITGTRTNLGLTDYTVTLAKGSIEGRFLLEISPIAQTPTDIENTGAGVQDNVRKVVVDGILYIVKEGVIYDAQGNRVK